MQMEIDQHAQAAIHALGILNTRINDALAGFETMLERAEPEFHDTVAAFVTLHRRHASEVSGMLARSGHSDEQSGSVMGAVNKAVVSMRALLDRIDADTLSQIAQGEKHVLAAFDDVINTALSQAHAVHIRQMQSELVDLMTTTGARV